MDANEVKCAILAVFAVENPNTLLLEALCFANRVVDRLFGPISEPKKHIEQPKPQPYVAPERPKTFEEARAQGLYPDAMPTAPGPDSGYIMNPSMLKFPPTGGG